MNTCFYCGEPMIRSNHRGSRHQGNHQGRRKLERTKDHLIPTSRGGNAIAYDIGNLVMCHRKCNEDKKNMTLQEYRAVVAARKGVPVEDFKFPGEKL